MILHSLYIYGEPGQPVAASDIHEEEVFLQGYGDHLEAVFRVLAASLLPAHPGHQSRHDQKAGWQRGP